MTKSSFWVRAIFGAALLGFLSRSQALTITSGPGLLQTTAAPLACKLQLSTDENSRVSVAVTDGQNSWTKDFYDYGTTHSVILLGFKPNRTNEITVTVHDKSRHQITATNLLVFMTDPLPTGFPKIVLLSSQPDRMEPGYTLFWARSNGIGDYIVIVDNHGEVVWYSTSASGEDVRQRPDGNLFRFVSTGFYEMNLFGENVLTWPAAPGWLVDLHDGVPTDHGTILYLSAGTQTVTNFPGSATNPNAAKHTVTVTHQPVVEISATNSALLNIWRTIDMINPRRVTYFYNGAISGIDWEHSNAVIEDPRDDSIIVSMRHQNAVIKFSRATGQLKWILGSHENWGTDLQQYLLTPVGSPFKWNFAQHAPKITPQGTLLVYDDGNFRANPFNEQVADADNHSRAVEYSINENTMEVSQVWEYGENTPERLFTPSVGDVDWLSKSGNILVTFGNITYVNGVHPSPYSAGATMVRIKEVTHEEPAEVVFDLELFDTNNTSPTYGGCLSYRSDRIPDLYSVQPGSVQDLTASYENGKPHLQFSADPSQSHRVEASTDLLSWEDIGSVTDESGHGEFNFVDDQADEFTVRFYRVVSSPH